MRNLYLLRGCPAVGKDYWLEKNGLNQYAISPDSLRLMFQTPVQDIYGVEGISQKNDGKVWDFVFELLEQRMKRGEFTIVNATHSRTKLINRYRELCKKYRYRCTIIDFKKDVKTILKQNQQRDKYKFVPEEVILRINERLKAETIPSWVKVIKPTEFKKHVNVKYDFTKIYKKIAVIGDIHGCFTALNKYFRENKFKKDTFYVFVGDFFDRGIQNAKVFKLVHKLMQNKNVLCLTGNHELHFHDYLNGKKCEECKSTGNLSGDTQLQKDIEDQRPEFQKICKVCKGSGIEGVKSWEFANTLKELKEAGIEEKDIKDFYNRLGQMAYFTFHKRDFVITHGGIPTEPSIYTATQDFIKGIGKYEDADIVDKTFVKNTKKNVYSLHGHRNIFDEKIKNTERTFNLEAKVEFGGYLRIVEITPKTFKKIEIKNNKFNKKLLKKDKKLHSKKSAPLTNNEAINILTRDKDIKTKDLGNNIYSYNFTNKVFRKRNWTDNSIKSRGLFIDTKKEKVVARSYDKFFNWGELDFVKSGSLKENLIFPVKAWRKENGFLGILSVYNNEWFIASKSTNQGDFAEYFKNLVSIYLTEDLKKFVKDNNVSLIFEVIDINNDPHIIKYNESKVVLLDVVYNGLDTKYFDSPTVERIAKLNGIPYKKLDYTFNNWVDLYKFKKEQDRLSRFDENVEGWVFEDVNNFRVKYKTKYYKFWKSMRWVKDAIIRKGGNHPEIRAGLHSLDDFTVYNEMIKIPLNNLKQMSIIDIRDIVMNNLQTGAIK